MPYPKKYKRPDRWCYISLAAVEVASLVVAAVGTTASIVAKQQAAAEQENQFRQQQVQLRLQQTDAESRRTDQLRRIFGEQAASEVARGISLAAPSFKDIQQQSFNAFNDDNRAESLSLSFKENALNSQIGATRAGANIGSFAIAANAAAGALGSMNLNNPNNINQTQTFQAGDELARERAKGGFNTNIPGLSP